MSTPCRKPRRRFTPSQEKTCWGRDRSPEAVAFERQIRRGVEAQVRRLDEIACATCRTPTPVRDLRGGPQRWTCPACTPPPPPKEKRKMPTPKHIIDQARALMAEGKSDTDIAQTLGIGRATAHRIRKRDPADDATLGRRGAGRKKEPSEAEAAGEDATEEVDELGWTEEEAAREAQRHDEHEAAQAKASDAARQEHIQAAHEKIQAKLAARRKEKAARRQTEVQEHPDPSQTELEELREIAAEWDRSPGCETSWQEASIGVTFRRDGEEVARWCRLGAEDPEPLSVGGDDYAPGTLDDLRAALAADTGPALVRRRLAAVAPIPGEDESKAEGQIATLKAEVARLENERIDLKRQALKAETAHTYALTAAEDATRAALREVEELRAQLAAEEELLHVYRESLVIRESDSIWFVDYPSNYSCHTSAQDAVLEAAIKLEVDLGLEVDRLRSEAEGLKEALVEAKRQRDVAHMLLTAARRVIAELEGVERARKEMDAAYQRLETSREALRNLEVVL